jgi:hypothetical protein
MTWRRAMGQPGAFQGAQAGGQDHVARARGLNNGNRQTISAE